MSKSTKKRGAVESAVDETLQYNLKDNRLYIKGVGTVEKKKDKPLPAQTVQALFDLCEKNGMSKALTVRKYLEVFVDPKELEAELLAADTDAEDEKDEVEFEM